jgi:signal transduction histidine kinase
VADVLMAAGLAVLGWFLPGPAPHPGGPGDRGVVPLFVVLLLAATVPLVWRRRWPLHVFAIVVVAVNLPGALVPAAGSLAGAGQAVAIYSVGAYRRLPVALAGPAGAVAVPWAVAVPAGRPYAVDVWESAIVGGIWALGVAVGWRRAHAADRRREQLERVRRQERARIARELHDVVAHHVSGMVVQAGAAHRVLADQPEYARQALGSIRSAGVRTLDALYCMVGLLSAEAAPGSTDITMDTPDIAELVAGLRHTGLAVDVRIDGPVRRMPADVALCAHRILQEALTNAARHAAATRVDVALRHDGTALEVSVEDDGRGGADPGPPGPETTGYGIAGMRERVALLGGELRVGPRPDGGWRVWARLPVG